ncbi:MAG: hypothetical protein C0594_03750 [Marinilabiliales bacterium]|nr:MAG: hypothetical protein C0594_03750 [Marinilabiliales bacterium]
MANKAYKFQRIHWFEFEDLDWIPSWIKSSITNLVVIVNFHFGVHKSLPLVLKKALEMSHKKRIVDMGSGAGGVMPEIMRKMHNSGKYKDISLLMTDRFPNIDAIKKFNNQKETFIQYSDKPLDALNLSNAPDGLNTMINCFHHLTPEQASQLLSSASKNKEPLLVYEMLDNNIPAWLWKYTMPFFLVALFFMALYMTPFVRPLSFRQIIFTYFVPVIPVLFAWDAWISKPRVYTQNDIKHLLSNLSNKDYKWSYNINKTEKGRKQGSYILGLPK